MKKFKVGDKFLLTDKRGNTTYLMEMNWAEGSIKSKKPFVRIRMPNPLYVDISENEAMIMVMSQGIWQ